MYSVALIGFGRAGGRFLRAIMHRQRSVGDIVLTAVCDTNAQRLKMFKDFNIKTYTDVQVMLDAGVYDIIIVATNEDSHYSILCTIKNNPNKYRRLLVEKLLVEKPDQADSIKSMFNEEEITVHFVERHSPVLQKLVDWMDTNDLNIKRATFFWGKYRLHDHRPTIGVTSEISHPIDLILMLSGITTGTAFEILQGSYLFSDYTYSGRQILDTINVNMRFGDNLIINGCSSFIWDKRERRLLLFLSNIDGLVTHIAAIDFDNPYWDIDTCSISKVVIGEGKRKLIHKWEIKKEDIHPDIFCISKTSNFLAENINEIKGEKKSSTLARLSQSCYIQSIVNSLEIDARQKVFDTPIFSAQRPNLKSYEDCDDLLYNFLKGDISEAGIIRWDQEF